MAHCLDIRWDPLGAPGVDDPAEAATWARIRISARPASEAETVLTQVYARLERSVRDEVFGTVLPLAEWVVRSWSHLVVARRARPGPLASGDDRYGWDRVHRWRFAGEGVAIPDLCFSRLDDAVANVAWSADWDSPSSRFERVRFLNRGSLRLPLSELQDCLAEFVDGVIRRLMAAAPNHERTMGLREDWNLVRSPDMPQHAAQTLAARLGLLWWDMEETERKRILELSGLMLNPVSSDLLDSARLEESGEALKFGDAMWNRCVGTPDLPKKWRDLRKAIEDEGVEVPITAEPWSRGWECARVYRRVRKLSEKIPLHMEDPLPWVEAPRVRALPGSADSVIAWRASHAPVRSCVRARQSSSGKLRHRFGLARDLYFVAFGARSDEDFARVVSPRVVGSTSIPNAFAAELLAPLEAVKHHLGGANEVDLFTVSEIASKLNAPPMCVRHQVENHKLAMIQDAA